MCSVQMQSPPLLSIFSALLVESPDVEPVNMEDELCVCIERFTQDGKVLIVESKLKVQGCSL